MGQQFWKAKMCNANLKNMKFKNFIKSILNAGT